jgi:hypothetical protein
LKRLSLIIAAFLLGLVVPVTAQTTCTDTGAPDALGMRNFRRYDDSFNLAPSQATFIQPGQAVPNAPNVYYPGGTRPFIARAAATVRIPINQNVTADLWVHTTGRVCNFEYQIHEHVDRHPNTGEIRRDFYKWKVQTVPTTIKRLIPSVGWHRFDLWQQRSNGSTIMDVHTGPQNRITGMHTVNAEVSWVT